MFYSLDSLKKEIRVALDQNNSSAALLDIKDIDTLTLEEIIESKIVDAAISVETDAPVHLLDTGKDFAASITWESEKGYGPGFTQLPDDFLRLICFKMSDWSYAVTEAVSEDSTMYMMQRSRYPGIRGCPERPVVAITSQPTGKMLEFYSCTSGERASVTRARYLPVPKIVKNANEHDGVEICERLKPAVVYKAAEFVAKTLNNVDLASIMMNMCNELMK